MLTQSIKNKVQDLWDKFWSGGISNPLNAIEQITYLLFMKQLDENDRLEVSNSAGTYKSIFIGKWLPPGLDGKKPENYINKKTLRWSSWDKLTPEELLLHMQTKVFPFIKQLGEENSFFTKHMTNAAFLIPSGRMLIEAIRIINSIFEELKKENRFIDAQGDFYEYLLKSLSSAGKNGQFRTPTHVIELIVELLEPKLNDRIADPACGTAGFLLGTYKYIITQYSSDKEQDDSGFWRGTKKDKLIRKADKEKLNKNTFYGFDIDPTMIRIGLMNLLTHGISQPNIDYKDTLSRDYNEDDKYDIVMANPPFTGTVDKEYLNKSFTITTTKSELLFVERIYKMLINGGTAGVVVPQGVLSSSGNAFKNLRRMLIEQCELKAVIGMPRGVFRPYAGVATAILIFTKGSKTKNIWMYDMESDGWSLDDKRTPLYNNDGSRNYGDLHLIIDAFKKRNSKKPNDRKGKHFFVSRKEVIENEFDLNVDKYRVRIYAEEKYDNPMVILNRLKGMETVIQKNIGELIKLVK